MGNALVPIDTWNFGSNWEGGQRFPNSNTDVTIRAGQIVPLNLLNGFAGNVTVIEGASST